MPKAWIQSLLRNCWTNFSSCRVCRHGIAYFGGNCGRPFALVVAIPSVLNACFHPKKQTLAAFIGMSALGQKRTLAVQNGMSALPPKAAAKADSRKRSCLL